MVGELLSKSKAANSVDKFWQTGSGGECLNIGVEADVAAAPEAFEAVVGVGIAAACGGSSTITENEVDCF